MARILVTEDNLDVLALMCHQLRNREHDVVGVELPEQALRLADSGYRPEVAVLDVMMPKMSGFKLIQALGSDAALRRCRQSL